MKMRSGQKDTRQGLALPMLPLLTWKVSSMRMMPPGSARCRWQVVTEEPAFWIKGEKGKG